MDNTSSDTSAHQRLTTTLPSQAHELLNVEKHELERRELEKKSLQATEAKLADELASALRNEKIKIEREGTESLQEFKKNDLTKLLTEENSKTISEADSVKNAGLASVNTAAKLIADTAISPDFLLSL